jgi:hypothetical protein
MARAANGSTSQRQELPIGEKGMEEFAQRTNNRRRQRRKAKASRNKVTVEPVLIAARRPDSPLIRTGVRNVVASAAPKRSSSVSYLSAAGEAAHTEALGENGVLANGGGDIGTGANGTAANSAAANGGSPVNAGSPANASGVGKRREVRIVQIGGNQSLDTDERKRRLLDRLVRAEGPSAISRVADDLRDSNFAIPKEQEVQLQLLEHENEERAREAVFIIAELLQKQPPIKRPILDQRLRRLEEYAEDPITRDAAAALRKSIRLHHG